jgi:hypothetical protein
MPTASRPCRASCARRILFGHHGAEPSVGVYAGLEIVEAGLPVDPVHGREPVIGHQDLPVLAVGRHREFHDQRLVVDLADAVVVGLLGGQTATLLTPLGAQQNIDPVMLPVIPGPAPC